MSNFAHTTWFLIAFIRYLIVNIFEGQINTKSLEASKPNGQNIIAKIG